MKYKFLLISFFFAIGTFALVNRISVYPLITNTRVPISDWHENTSGKHVGFQARSVVGGYYIKMLESSCK